MSVPIVLTTTLSEIRSFNPCPEGWRDILKARNPQCPEDYDKPFPLVECLESNSISDVCWLLGNRKNEIGICVKFARMCADSVAHLDNDWARHADAAVDAAYAAYAAAYAAVYDAVYADAYDAYEAQKEKNKQFLIQCINEFTA